MPNPLPDELYPILWCAAALAACWVLGPKLLAMLGQTRCAVAIVGGPEALHPKGDDAQYDDLFETLTELGFAPLGAKVEIGWFMPQRWHRRALPARIFATAEHDCFASLYRLYIGDSWRVAFCTVFTDDSLVMTSNNMANLRIEQEGYLRWACPSPDLAEVLRQHRLTAENYRAADGRTVDSPGLDGICEAIRYHSERFLRKKGPELAVKNLPNALMFLCGPPALAGVWFGFGHWTVPVAVVLGGIGDTAFLPLALRIGTRKLREQDRERGLADQWARQREARRVLRESPRLPDALPASSSDAITPRDRAAPDDDRFTRGPRPRA